MSPPHIFGPRHSRHGGRFGRLSDPGDDLSDLLVHTINNLVDDAGALESLARIRLGRLRPTTDALSRSKTEVKDYLWSGNFSIAFLACHNGEDHIYGFNDRRRARLGRPTTPPPVARHSWTSGDPNADAVVPDIVLHRNLAIAHRVSAPESAARTTIAALISMVFIHGIAHLVRSRFGPDGTLDHVRGVLPLGRADIAAKKGHSGDRVEFDLLGGSFVVAFPTADARKNWQFDNNVVLLIATSNSRRIEVRDLSLLRALTIGNFAHFVEGLHRQGNFPSALTDAHVLARVLGEHSGDQPPHVDATVNAPEASDEARTDDEDSPFFKYSARHFSMPNLPSVAGGAIRGRKLTAPPPPLSFLAAMAGVSMADGANSAPTHVDPVHDAIV